MALVPLAFALWAGQPDLAIGRAETSLRLSPRGRFGSPTWVIGTAQFLSRHFDEALAKLLIAAQETPTFRCYSAPSPRPMPIWAGATKRGQ